MLIYFKLIKASQTLYFIYSRLFVLGICLIVFNTEIVANELPEVDYYNNIDLIKGISNDYSKNIGTVAKKQTTKKKLKNIKIMTDLVNKNVKRRRGIVKKQVNIQKKHVIKRQNFAKKKPFEQPIIYEVNDCKDKSTSTLSRNEMESCFDVATDVPTYSRPVNLNSEYLGLGVNSRPIDLGITPLDTGKIMLFGKNVNILDR